eukprot:COSAG05_NODE_2230_length_3362_cov_2.287466_1_plen_63_part_00
MASSQGKHSGQKMAQLARFGRAWVKAHADVDQRGYTKCAVKAGLRNGIGLECVFYPKPKRFL